MTPTGAGFLVSTRHSTLIFVWGGMMTFFQVCTVDIINLLCLSVQVNSLPAIVTDFSKFIRHCLVSHQEGHTQDGIFADLADEIIF